MPITQQKHKNRSNPKAENPRLKENISRFIGDL
jgi:hypothetical protein